jgi:hypothetical protein
MSYARAIVLTSLAMIAFAGNSILCRLALKNTSMDPATFTTIRLLGSDDLTIARLSRGTPAGRGNWLSALALFIGAGAFCLMEPAAAVVRYCSWSGAGNDDRPRPLGGRTSAATARGLASSAGLVGLLLPHGAI